MISRRQFLVSAALGPVLFRSMPTGIQDVAPAQRETGSDAHEPPQESTEPAREIKPAPKAPDRLIIINPGHYKYSGENLGTYLPAVGHEYIINTQISRALHSKLKDIGLQAVVTRDEENYLPDIVQFIADHNARLQAEYHAYISATNNRRHRELGRREAILQLGIMRYAEARRAAAMIHIHVDDQLSKRGRRRSETKGFSLILNNTASVESERLQRELCSALRTTLPLNRSYHIKNPRRGIFILGNSRLCVSVPSCLVECGFMTQQYLIDGNKKDICDPDVQDVYAASLARGLANFFGKFTPDNQLVCSEEQ